VHRELQKSRTQALDKVRGRFRKQAAPPIAPGPDEPE
jgi:hypothetical protein